MSEVISFLAYTVMYGFLGVVLLKSSTFVLELIGKGLSLPFYGPISKFNEKTENLTTHSFLFGAIIIAILGLISAAF